MASIIEIQNFSDPALDLYARLTENQLLNRADPENALFIAESPLVIGRALDAGCKPVSFLMERQHIGGKGREILARCYQDIPVRRFSRQAFHWYLHEYHLPPRLSLLLKIAESAEEAP